jgi:hypothetical protein
MLSKLSVPLVLLGLVLFAGNGCVDDSGNKTYGRGGSDGGDAAAGGADGGGADSSNQEGSVPEAGGDAISTSDALSDALTLDAPGEL